MTEQEIEAKFRSGDLNYLEAIQELQNIGLSEDDATETVCEWEEEVYEGEEEVYA